MGMAGFFSALIRLPLTAVIIVFEMTSVADSDTPILFPMLLTSMVAYFSNEKMQGENLWDLVLEQDNIDPHTLQMHFKAGLENMKSLRPTKRLNTDESPE